MAGCAATTASPAQASTRSGPRRRARPPTPGLRLGGAQASPRGLVWRRAIHGFALVALLYQALAATIDGSRVVASILRSPGRYPPESAGDFASWTGPILGLLWIAAFCCLVLGRPVATRVLVVLAAGSAIGTTLALSLVYSGYREMITSPTASNVSRWGWLAVSTIAAFVVPTDARPSRRLWLGTLVVGSLMLVPAAVVADAPPYHMWPSEFLNLSAGTRVAVLAGITVALATSADRRRDPRWLLAFAAFGGGWAVAQLLRYYRYRIATATIAFERPAPMSFWNWFDVLLVGLAVVCAVVGLLSLQRLARSRPEARAPGPPRTHRGAMP